jgi:outer membrane autotransporter protein
LERYNQLSYHGFAGADAFGPAASGTFPGNRWVASTGLTGTYNLARWEIEPSAKIYALWERGSQFVESGGALVNAASFATGRASGGAKVAYPWYADARVTIAPYVGAYADYYFDNNGWAPLLLPTQFIRGLAGRVTAGLAYNINGGPKLSVGGELGGLATTS